MILDGPTPERPERPVQQIPTEFVEYDPAGSAEENLPVFIQTLENVTGGEEAFSGRSLVAAFEGVGFERDSMQVSFDRTRTDLEVESMFISVKIDDACLIGQVVTEDRSFVAEAASTVGPDSNLCLIGKTQSIDW